MGTETWDFGMKMLVMHDDRIAQSDEMENER